MLYKNMLDSELLNSDAIDQKYQQNIQWTNIIREGKIE
jgi:hypothetical protein